MDEVQQMQRQVDAARETSQHMAAGVAAFKHLIATGRADEQCENAAREMIRLGDRDVSTLEGWENEVIAECARVLIYRSGSVTLGAQ